MRSICNFGYARTRKGGPHFPDVRGLLRYLQYRDDREGHIPSAGGLDRWVDGGLGDSYPLILARLNELNPANRFAYCHALVISPDPEAMTQIEGDAHARFVEAVKETIAEWDEWRLEHDEQPQAGPIEYAFVVHRPERNYGEQIHAHVIMAAATEHSLTLEATPLYNNRDHIERFKEITYHQLDRAFDLDREREDEEPEVELELEGEHFERERDFIHFRQGDIAVGQA